MSNPTRIQLSRRKGWKLPPNTVVVSRPTKWGNPFVVGRDGTRAECVELFRKLLSGFLCVSCKTPPADQIRSRIDIIRGLPALRGKNLACWCPLNQPCHADTLLEIANA